MNLRADLVVRRVVFRLVFGSFLAHTFFYSSHIITTHTPHNIKSNKSRLHTVGQPEQTYLHTRLCILFIGLFVSINCFYCNVFYLRNVIRKLNYDCNLLINVGSITRAAVGGALLMVYFAENFVTQVLHIRELATTRTVVYCLQLPIVFADWSCFL